MGFALLPLIVLAFFGGLNAMERSHAEGLLPPSIVSRATQQGQAFISYRNAVVVYQQNNPAFTGTVSNTALATQGLKSSAEFLALASNSITAVGVSGRVITAYAALTPGALRVARDLTENDGSLGMASGSSWSSVSPGSILVPLATTVPNGSVVSVIQIGN